MQNIHSDHDGADPFEKRQSGFDYHRQNHRSAASKIRRALMNPAEVQACVER